MVKRLKKSKYAKCGTFLKIVDVLRPRFFGFMFDWAAWGYVAYATMYFLNQYWYTWYVDWYGTLVLPPWGWPVVVLATLELTILMHAFGHSIGMGLFESRLITTSIDYPSLNQRWNRYLWMHASIALLPLTLARIGKNGALLHDRRSGTQMRPWKDVKDNLLMRKKPRPWIRTQSGVMTLALIGLTFWLGWEITEIDLAMLFSRAGMSARIWKDLVNPDFVHFLQPDPMLGESIVQGLIESIFIALLATLMGGVIAFPLSFLGARNIMGFSPLGWLVFAVMRAFFNIIRSIQSILWAVVFAVWVGFGPFAGVLALTLHTMAALGKLFSEQVEGIDPGPLEAIASTGGRRVDVVLYGVIPQIVPSFLAFSLYRWDINIRMATVIALVGGGGIGRILFYYKNQVGFMTNAWNQVGAVVIAIVAVIWLLDYVSGRVREKII